MISGALTFPSTLSAQKHPHLDPVTNSIDREVQMHSICVFWDVDPIGTSYFNFEQPPELPFVHERTINVAWTSSDLWSTPAIVLRINQLHMGSWSRRTELTTHVLWLHGFSTPHPNGFAQYPEHFMKHTLISNTCIAYDWCLELILTLQMWSLNLSQQHWFILAEKRPPQRPNNMTTTISQFFTLIAGICRNADAQAYRL